MKQLDLFYDKLPQYIITWDFRLNDERRTYNVYDDWNGLIVARFFENEDNYKDFWNRRNDWYADHEIKYFQGTHQSAMDYIKNTLGQRYRYV